MTLPSTVNRNEYLGTGPTGADTFDYTFPIFLDGDLLVTVRDTSNAETTLALGTDYTVAGAGDPDGEITLVAGPLAAGYTITIRRVVDLLQQTDIRNQGSFFPETHEDAFDYGVMIDQQLQDQISRCFKLPETEAGTASSTTLPYATDRASKYFAWDVSGNPIASDGGAVGYLYNISPFMLTVLDDTTAAAARATLGVTNPTISTWGASLIDDADASAGQTTLGISNFIKTLLNDADSATARATLEVTQANLGITAFAQTILDDADAASVRATIGVTTGDPIVYMVESNIGASNGGSITDVPVSGMTITPASGTYLVTFTGYYVAAPAGGTQLISIYKGAVISTYGQIQISTTGSASNPVVVRDYVDVNGSDVISVKWSTTAGPDQMNHRMLTAERMTFV